MDKILLQDLYRYEGDRCKSLKVQLRYMFFTPGFTFLYFFRKASNSKFLPIKIFWLICHRLCMWQTGIQIPVGTNIGAGMKIGHFGTIVINPDAEIGRNFNISQGCLIGNAQGRHAGVPRIGDNVCMSANSVIVGGVTIGHDVMIAPGAFVNFDVPDNCIVIGNPGKIIEREKSPSMPYMVYPLADE